MYPMLWASPWSKNSTVTRVSSAASGVSQIQVNTSFSGGVTSRYSPPTTYGPSLPGSSMPSRYRPPTRRSTSAMGVDHPASTRHHLVSISGSVQARKTVSLVAAARGLAVGFAGAGAPLSSNGASVPRYFLASLRTLLFPSLHPSPFDYSPFTLPPRFKSSTYCLHALFIRNWY